MCKYLNDCVYRFSDEHLSGCKMSSLTRAILGIKLLVHSVGNFHLQSKYSGFAYRGRVVRKPINANSRLEFSRGFHLAR